MSKKDNILEFYNSDFEGTLFPMATCQFIIENAYDELDIYLKKVANPQERAYCFLPQQVVYASKAKQHLRRTKKLDPIAEFYMYQMAYENRTIFNRSQKEERLSFGYKFKDGKVVAINESFLEFNKQLDAIKSKYKYYIQFDISSYFNSIYHHDLINWFASCGVSTSEVELLGQFMREINGGFSIDFMPHGIYPSKMLGSHFLSYIDYSMLVKSEEMCRFMDDFIIASDSKETVTKDFQTIQKLLGQKSLNINSHKTHLYTDNPEEIDVQVNEVIKNIFGEIIIYHGSDVGYETFEDVLRELTAEEVTSLISLLDKANISDREASLVLEAINSFNNELHKYLPIFLHQHPNLIKKVYVFSGQCNEKNMLAEEFYKLVSKDNFLNEYQLFWLAKIVETHLIDTPYASKLLSSLYEHKDATIISKAKILEIPEHRYGMPELRETHLKNGSSGWLAWASAVGMRKDNKQAKNYLMDYFSKVSPINKLIGDCIKNI
jgi:hypothetical protein